ncbi:serine/threonine-protein phosphatase 6 regulatory ankyrin repeat subunit B-like isoform X2 [Mizuhopecten yessoensis]|uniref:serine/threonine-protein phosphatase 6 regulatory ankyrin repeat subunit B-like isoform X2 n=1 Tax=Mizuhopecten yessoensis TaxID=6573 RepID=UPI000B45CF81|nr:serine/threonine-protein phosphatase 6 regulatory ankyrin repeat subunit B-like isoform X2 [Mizuhopecten yessoensis]
MSLLVEDEERLEPIRLEEHESAEHKKFYDCLLQGTIAEIKEWNKDDMYNTYFKNGLAPIHVTAMSGRDDEMEEILTILLKGGADVNAKTKSDHNSVLHLLIKHNHISVAFPGVVAALDYFPDVHWRNRHLRTAYDIAVAREYFDIASCVDGTMMPADARALYGRSVGVIYGKRLMAAILNNDEEDAILSVNKGANCNILNDHGCAAIHYVFTVYELPPMPLVTAMHQKKADLNITDSEGDTALNLCVKSRPLRLSGQMNNIVAALVRWGALSTYKDLDGNDALALATERNYNDIVRLLKKDRAQHILDMEEMAEMELLQAGLKDHDEDEEDNASSVSLAFEDDYQEFNVDSESLNESDLEELAEGDDDFMAALNDPNVDVNKPNEIGLYPIHLAVMNTDANKRKTIIKLLMDKGADINIKAIEDDDHDQDGNTPLHIAAWRNHLVSVKQILSYKPEYNTEDNDGKTARDIAEENGFTKIVELIDKYAKIAEKWKEPEQKSKSCTIL